MPGTPDDRVDPFFVFFAGDRGQSQELGIAPDHGERPADLVDDARQQPTDLGELLVEHRQAGHLAELDQAAHPAEYQRRGGILGDVIVGPRLHPREDIGVVMPHGEHQDRDRGRLGISPKIPADVESGHVGEVDIEYHDMRPNLTGLPRCLAALGHFIDRVSGTGEDRSQQGTIRCVIVDDQDGTTHRGTLRSLIIPWLRDHHRFTQCATHPVPSQRMGGGMLLAQYETPRHSAQRYNTKEIQDRATRQRSTICDRRGSVTAPASRTLC